MSLAKHKPFTLLPITLVPIACIVAALGGTMLLARPPLQVPQVAAPQVAAAPGEGPRQTKHDLTPQSFARLHQLIRAQDNEWRHLKVHWHTDVAAARKKAAREDKPIIIVYTMGAGYNDPLGIC